MFEELRSSSKHIGYSFIEVRLKLFEKKKRGQQWSEKDITLALSLFNASRKSDRLLSKMFSLPSLSCLRGSMGNINVG